VIVPQSFMDDEYRMAGITEPKVMVTTARDPSTKLSAFAKEIRLLFPNAQRVNRGNHVVSQLVEVARQNEITDIVVLHEHRGVPDGLIISHMPFGPTVKFGLYNVVTRSDIGTLPNMSEQYPHLIFDNFKSNLGERVSIILKHLFPTPKTDSKRVMTFANRSDFISFRHHNWRRGRNKKLRPDSGNKKEEAAEQDEGGESDEETIGTLGRNEIELLEVGPRFELRLFEITNGTLDSATADKEWVYRPYMNSRKKRRMDDL
jgi:U3 small nucleolar ribonucleoprotein protein IMP4